MWKIVSKQRAAELTLIFGIVWATGALAMVVLDKPMPRIIIVERGGVIP